MDHIEIDGAAGGGQLLRTALTLSLCTGTAFAMSGIRARRARPGLMRQHLTAVTAATQIGQAKATGAELGATVFAFEPGTVTPGSYRFAIGTAGSATLVLQTLLPALWRADAPSRIELEGGTHNSMAPSADFIADTWTPMLARMGVAMRFQLERHGFYPAGGGRIVAEIEPCAALRPLRVTEAAPPSNVNATALIAALSPDIGVRELKVAARELGLDESALSLQRIPQAIGPGNALLVRVHRADHVEVFTGFGERGVLAEQVAENIARDVRDYLEADVPVGPHLADQLLLPMALAGGGEFVTMAPSEHLRSNAALIEKFLPVEIDWQPLDERRWHVTVR